MGKRALKGGDFERVFCRQLSLWWSGGKRDDLFWRTAGSGAMASSRVKLGHSQKQGHGDIMAIDRAGEVLTELVTWELKRGYPEACPWAVVEGRGKNPAFLAFLDQAEQARAAAKANIWAIVHRRDRKNGMIYLPETAWALLPPVPESVLFDYGFSWQFRGVNLELFFEAISPVAFDEMLLHIMGDR